MNYVGPIPVPNDTNLADFLTKLRHEATLELEVLLSEFSEVIDYGKEEGEPEEFAYARLLNQLATIETPKLIRILSAAIWRIQIGT